MIPTVDTPTTSVLLLTADTRLRTPTGDLHLKDALALRTVGTGALGGVQVPVGGTEEWNGASGQVRLSATYHATYGGAGTYRGQVCTG